jgi:hypothetical protein
MLDYDDGEIGKQAGRFLADDVPDLGIDYEVPGYLSA